MPSRCTLKRIIAGEQALTNIKSLRSEIARLKVKRKRLLDLYIDGMVDLEDYREQRKESTLTRLIVLLA
jgi:hypothetical protein